jgi:hypothetical protein
MSRPEPPTPSSRPARTVDTTAWVDAAPFAAHLHRLGATSGLPWQVVATFAGVPLRTAARLVPDAGPTDRRAPRLRRIPRSMARRLWSVEADDLRRLRSTWVDGGPTCARVVHLLATGVPPRQLAAHLACTLGYLECLVDSRPATVTAEVAVRARVAAETADRAFTRRALAAA